MQIVNYLTSLHISVLGMAQGPVQFTIADFQNAMLNLFLYNSLNQQPALQNHFAWSQAAASNVAASNRTPFRASYEHQQQAEKLFSQPALSRTDTPWYDSTSVNRQPQPTQTSVSTVPPRNPPVTASTHPYLTFPFPYSAAALAAATAPPQHFYYQTTPGYYYQPAPTAPVTPPEAQNSASGTNGAVNHTAATNHATNAMNDFMATIVTANQMPFIAPPAYPTASAGATDMSKFLRF